MYAKSLATARGTVINMGPENQGRPQTPASGVPHPPKDARQQARADAKPSHPASGGLKASSTAGGNLAKTPPSATKILSRGQDKIGGPARSSGTRVNLHSTRISLAGVGQGAWCCAQCRKELPKDALAKGLADLANGTLLCADCRGGGKKKKNVSLAFLRVPLAVMAALAAASAVFFPGYLLFVLCLASLALVLTGSLAFTQRGVVRVILAGSGLCGLIVSLWSLSFLRDRQTLRQEEEDVNKAAGLVYAALKEGSYLEAQSRYRSFMALAMPTQGCFRSARAEKSAVEIRAAMDKWLKDSYGSLSSTEASVLANLLSLYGEKCASGSNRFSHLKLGEDLASLRVVVDDEVNPQGDRGSDANALEKARAVLKTLRATYPDTRRYELSLAVDGNGSETRELGTIVVLPGQESIVEMGGDLQPLIGK